MIIFCIFKLKWIGFSNLHDANYVFSQASQLCRLPFRPQSIPQTKPFPVAFVQLSTFLLKSSSCSQLYLRQIQNSLFSIFTNDSLCEDPIVKCLFVTIKYFRLIIFIALYKNLRFVPFLNLFLGSTVIYTCTTWQLMESFVSGWMIPHTRSVSVGCNVLHTTLSLHINCPDAIISDLLLPQKNTGKGRGRPSHLFELVLR